jgi:hypothetical protein
MTSSVTRRSFLGRVAAATGALGGLAPAGCATAGIAARPSRPLNVLVVLADDLGWGDLSCYGRPDYVTPALDALAGQGVRLLDAYAASCVCAPARAALLTGRYPQRLGPGFTRPIVFRTSARPEDAAPVGLSPDVPTLASLLRARGHRTALVGKWHLGYPPRFSPLRSGFDEFFGITSGAVDYFTHRDAGGLPGSLRERRAGRARRVPRRSALGAGARRDRARRAAARPVLREPALHRRALAVAGSGRRRARRARTDGATTPASRLPSTPRWSGASMPAWAARLKYARLDGRESLFDLDADEREVADLAAARPADVARMRGRTTRGSPR